MKINNYFIDKYFGGISDNEFMIVGCPTGFGKTSWGNCLCFDSVKIGLKPALFSLENTQGDTLRVRAFLVWKELSKQYDSLYREWKEVTESDSPPEYTVESFAMAAQQLSQIILYENQGVYTMEDLARDLENAKNQGANFIVLDHIDFIDQDENVFVSGTRIANYIKTWVDKNRIPVIAFSQIAKILPKDVVIPNSDMFYGSNNKIKLATSVLALTRDKEHPNDDKYLYPSYFVVRKDRYGSKINCGEIINFDIRTGGYQDSGTKIGVSHDGTKVFFIND